jgi:hypothetical protein
MWRVWMPSFRRLAPRGDVLYVGRQVLGNHAANGRRFRPRSNARPRFRLERRRTATGVELFVEARNLLDEEYATAVRLRFQTGEFDTFDFGPGRRLGGLEEPDGAFLPQKKSVPIVIRKQVAVTALSVGRAPRREKPTWCRGCESGRMA